MTSPIQRIAYTVECFLNTLRLDDGRPRTEVEEWLTQWLAQDSKAHAVYHNANIYCHSDGNVVKSFSVPEAKETRAIWCGRSKLSVIDAQVYGKSGALVMLGTAGLMLGMPGQAEAAKGGSGSGAEISWDIGEGNSNNNNNNNNNNNG